MAVLNKVGEVICRGNGQVGFRIASIRQELMVDVLPELDNIKLYAEFLQAESEELALATSGKAQAATPAPAAPNAGNPVIKAVADYKPAEGTPGGWDKKKAPGATCRFWGTDGGCRKGNGCGYVHSWDGIVKTNRCFLCSGVGHAKKDCPVKKDKEPAAPKVAVSRMVKGREEDGRKVGGGQGSTDLHPGAPQGGCQGRRKSPRNHGEANG